MKNAEQLRRAAGDSLGLSFTYPSELSPAERETLYDRMADMANASPKDYEAIVVQWAEKRRASPFYMQPIVTYSVGDAVADFAGEIGNQAVTINDAVNPFSEANRGKVLVVLAVALVVGVAIYAYRLAPQPAPVK